MYLEKPTYSFAKLNICICVCVCAHVWRPGILEPDGLNLNPTYLLVIPALSLAVPQFPYLEKKNLGMLMCI